MNVLLVEDHALFAESLAYVLRRALPQVQVSHAPSCAAALAQVRAADMVIDLILLDLGLPGCTGLDALVTLREHLEVVPIIVVSAHRDRATILAAIDHGAMGFIPKTSSERAFVAALQVFLAGGIYLPRSVHDPDDDGQFTARPQGCAPAVGASVPQDFGLTPRETAVLRLLVEGRSNKAIARALDIAEATVKAHAHAACRKLKVTRRTEAIVAASRLNLQLRADQAPPESAT
jgi:DNA-binding NarL/FixJ family response regulator